MCESFKLCSCFINIFLNTLFFKNPCHLWDFKTYSVLYSFKTFTFHNRTLIYLELFSIFPYMEVYGKRWIPILFFSIVPEPLNQINNSFPMEQHLYRTSGLWIQVFPWVTCLFTHLYHIVLLELYTFCYWYLSGMLF